ncbi:MAG: hypothetical protein KKD33_01330 [Verrucomicrobia bacterium]|nr:hypothetical protein [Verrucomicrobiota bacterium]MBU4286159.1 hypothetical protein [Verrucomicrobiota bacterium]MBU4366334.1 hypothetical protein [Verrucomicrobiota bacterium]
MKTRIVGIGWMTAVLIAGQLAYGQERPSAPRPEAPPRAIEIRHKQLDIEQRQSEMYFNNEMRKIKLEQKRLELARDRKMQQTPDAKTYPGKNYWRGHHKTMKYFCGLMLICMVVHILLAIWVYRDIRHRNAGSGLWIVITLLTGLLGALVYAVARLGDKPARP